MSEFKLNCEQFLATTRQHFFAGDLVDAFEAGDDGGFSCPASGAMEHRPHN
ncbi:hypothetical protein [Candidatus Accumulibacter aalborgensis]|uniref:hypothetical protein n=1 Tax=Candidatus Accumulibacter aalborgensis TaxID=1860102 RepID=UPI001647149B|nr:hypothetical protein [Candidatus Accumulibacter aalborgensis]